MPTSAKFIVSSDFQNTHRENWEAFCIERGFARWAEMDAERREHGNIVSLNLHRIVQANECCFNLSGKNKRAGG